MAFVEVPEWFHLVCQWGAFTHGTALASFAGVCVDRLPHDRSVVAPGSRCDVCGYEITWRDKVPVFSWLWLQGKCRQCGSHVPARVMFIELFGGLVGWLLYIKFVPDAAHYSQVSWMAFLYYQFFFLMLIVAALTDVRWRIVHEATSSYAVPVGILGALGLETIGYTGWPGPSLLGSVAGAAIGGGGMAAIAYAWLFIRGEIGLGWGDVRLIAMIGSFVGVFPGGWVVLLFASLLASLFGILHHLSQGEGRYLPFAPALSVSSAVWVLYGDRLVPWIFPGGAFIP